MSYTRCMDESTQTTPKGYKIPIPRRKDFEDALTKIANPKSKPKGQGSTRSGPVK